MSKSRKGLKRGTSVSALGFHALISTALIRSGFHTIADLEKAPRRASRAIYACADSMDFEDENAGIAFIAGQQSVLNEILHRRKSSKRPSERPANTTTADAP